MYSTIATQWEFCSAHYLPKVPDTHKCKRLHGHNYVLHVRVSGERRGDGMLIDFFELDAVVKPLLDQLVDHRCLNDVEGLENPTAEVIAEWFLRRLVEQLPGLHVVCRIYETPSCFAEVAGPLPKPKTGVSQDVGD